MIDSIVLMLAMSARRERIRRRAEICIGPSSGAANRFSPFLPAFCRLESQSETVWGKKKKKKPSKSKAS